MLTLVSVNFDIKLGEEELSKIEQANIYIPAGIYHEFGIRHSNMLTTYLSIIFLIKSSDRGSLVLKCCDICLRTLGSQHLLPSQTTTLGLIGMHAPVF